MMQWPFGKERRDSAMLTQTAPLQLQRADQLARLGDEAFDLLVIGGGITGAYAALDASLRGLRVALVEKDDFASGTSSKSSKMVHGGLRYIEQGNLGLVRHSLLERQRLRLRGAGGHAAGQGTHQSIRVGIEKERDRALREISSCRSRK